MKSPTWEGQSYLEHKDNKLISKYVTRQNRHSECSNKKAIVNCLGGLTTLWLFGYVTTVPDMMYLNSPRWKCGYAVVVVVVELAPDEGLLVLRLGVRGRGLKRLVWLQ